MGPPPNMGGAAALSWGRRGRRQIWTGPSLCHGAAAKYGNAIDHLCLERRHERSTCALILKHPTIRDEGTSLSFFFFLVDIQHSLVPSF